MFTTVPFIHINSSVINILILPSYYFQLLTLSIEVGLPNEVKLSFIFYFSNKEERAFLVLILFLKLFRYLLFNC